jgi:hypothetical protein
LFMMWRRRDLPSTICIMNVSISLLSTFVIRNVKFRMCLAVCYPYS